MSLAASMQSWCDSYKAKCNDRAEAIVKIKKDSCHVVQQHNDHRLKIGVNIRKKLHDERIKNMKIVTVVLKNYVKDRSEAIEILAAMRSKKISDKE